MEILSKTQVENNFQRYESEHCVQVLPESWWPTLIANSQIIRAGILRKEKESLLFIR
jgi:hypothetical protein